MPKNSYFTSSCHHSLSQFHPYATRRRTRQTRAPDPTFNFESNVYQQDPHGELQYQLLRSQRELVTQGNIVTFRPEIMSWEVLDPPMRLLKSGVMKTVAPPSYEGSPGYEVPVCPDILNRWRTREECTMKVTTVHKFGKTKYRYTGGHPGCVYGMDIPYDGVQTLEPYEDENSEDEIADILLSIRTPDIFSTAHFNTCHTDSSSASSSRISDYFSLSSPGTNSSITQYSLNQRSSSSNSSNFGSSSPEKAQPLATKKTPFTIKEMAARKNYDMDLIANLRQCEEDEIFHGYPQLHPAWPGTVSKKVHPRLKPYEDMHPSILFMHMDFHDTPSGRLIQDLNSITGVIPGAFRTLVETSRVCPACVCEYSSTAFMSHIQEGHCMNSSSDDIVRQVVSLDPHINNRLSDLRQNLPSAVRKKDSLLPTTVGMLFAMWNSRLGLPLDLWILARTAIITCKNCFLVRTFDAHQAHQTQDGLCLICIALGEMESEASGEEGSQAVVPYQGKGKGRAD
ncbi:hypothetical protein E1B28_006925 [Marasmius oreades]|uniref:Uncharacterized protein n=1 Tax=Marasmius oreades TaxID=181124 RepID=A0A9P7S0P2_9AGAR|nr:uncharacterized protein E1B28_006925 [Marasmius oreades]KAG7093239.1 hypothetical protein E1B28_006925 [Marasmius oreades]